jgi:N-acetylneuraminic acid mutarotase
MKSLRRGISAPFCEPLEPRRLLSATTLRIDVGGAGYVEASGKTWQPDRGFTAGAAVSSNSPIAGTTEDGLFLTRRAGNFSYSLPIRNGTYKVKLLFTDPYFTAPGQRIFNVVAERQPVMTNVDLVKLVGTDNAVRKSLKVKVRDGRLNLWFQSVKDNPTLSAIEVTPWPTAKPAGIEWKPLADAPQAKFESMGAVVHGKLYVMGGYTSPAIQATAQVASYNPATNTWTPLKDMPEPLTHSGTATDKQYIYLAGGYVGDWYGASTPVTRHVWRYDTSSDTWVSMRSLPANRSAGALVRVGRKLHFFGGLDQHKHDRSDHWTLDLRHPTRWIAAASVPDPRNHLGYAETGGQVYAIGGQHNLDEAHGNDDQVDAFNVVTNVWTQVASLPRPTSHTHNATFADGGNVIIVGGSSTDEESLQEVMEYTPATNKWTSIGQLPVPLSAAVARLIDGHIIITGGTSGASQPRTQTWISA